MRSCGDCSTTNVRYQVSDASSDFPIAAINNAGYGAACYGQKAWNGAAILAKGSDPIERVTCSLAIQRTKPEPRERYAALLEQGWTDALRTIHGDERIYTFWDYLRRRHGSGYGLRIDHLLVSGDLAARLKDANVDAWVRNLADTSDHAPTWIELGAAPRSRTRRVGSRKSE